MPRWNSEIICPKSVPPNDPGSSAATSTRSVSAAAGDTGSSIAISRGATAGGSGAVGRGLDLGGRLIHSATVADRALAGARPQVLEPRVAISLRSSKECARSNHSARAGQIAVGQRPVAELARDARAASGRSSRRWQFLSQRSMTLQGRFHHLAQAAVRSTPRCRGLPVRS